MSDKFDSVYPDLLRTGLARLGMLDARREHQALFSALEHFRRDLHSQESIAGILRVTQRYVEGLNLFRSSGFWLVNSTDFSFELNCCVPDFEHSALEQLASREIRSGRFARALRQGSSVFIHADENGATDRGVLHSLALSNQVIGMFAGVLQRELAPSQEISISLLSVLLGSCADMLATWRKTTQLADEINTLSGLLPLCAWCKKIRDDQGYWKQIESYVSAHTDASFTHSICPECEGKLRSTLPEVCPHH